MGSVLKLVVIGVVLLVLLFLAAGVLPRLLLLFSRPSMGESSPPLPVNVSYPVLGSLGYRFTSAREHASWIWGNLSEYSVGDPAVSPYLEWLRSVLEPGFRKHPHRHGDYVLVDSPVATRRVYSYFKDPYDGWIVEERVEPVGEAVLPAEGTRVRIGYARLPFGYGLILTAYQDSEGYINIVIHGTVLNETEFLELVVRSAAYPLHGGDGVNLFYMQYCMEPPSEYCFTYPPLHPHTPVKPRTYWFLWRIALPGYGQLEVNESLRIPVRHVYILLEMPLLGEEPVTWVFDPLLLGPETQGIYNTTVIRVLRTLEHTYLALSHTAFGLASNFARIDEDPLTVVKIIALHNVVYDLKFGRYKSPLEARLVGRAVCHGFSTSTGITASILGYPAVVVGVLHPLGGHGVSGFLRLSSTGERGSVRMPVDLDLDGVPDTYDVIADTAYMSRESLEEKFLSIGYFYPPLMPHGFWGSDDPPRLPNGLVGLDTGQEVRALLNGLIGVPQAVIGLPEWLKTPALIRYQWFTELWLNRTLGNYSLYEGGPFVMYIICGYAYDEASDSLVESPKNCIYADLDPYSIVYVDLMVRTIFREKNIGPWYFTPPSAEAFRQVLGGIRLLYENTSIPDTRVYLRRYMEWYKQRALEELNQTIPPWFNQDQGQSQEPATREYEAEVFLEPVYMDTPVYRGDEVVAVAKAIVEWNGRVVVDGVEYTVMLKPGVCHSDGKPLLKLVVSKQQTIFLYDACLEPSAVNGTTVEFRDGGDTGEAESILHGQVP